MDKLAASLIEYKILNFNKLIFNGLLNRRSGDEAILAEPENVSESKERGEEPEKVENGEGKKQVRSRNISNPLNK